MDIRSMNLGPDDVDESESTTNLSSDRRPNKFSGLNSTWREFTKEERLTNIFVTQMRQQDISVHLYNTQAMKARCYNTKETSELDPWSSKDHWRKLRYIQVEDHSEFVPPKSWTAWPLTPDLVPRAGEYLAPDKVDRWAPSRKIRQDSLELEDILTASTLRLAKEIFQARAWTSQLISEESLHDTMIKTRDEEPGEAGENIFLNTGQEHQGETQEHKTQNRASEIAAKRPEREPEPGYPLQIPFKSRGQFSSQKCHIMEDDEKSFAILRPTIRHNLALLDGLLISLHNTRKECLHHGSDTQSESEIEDDRITLSQNDNLNITPILPNIFSTSEVLSPKQTLRSRTSSECSSKNNCGRETKHHTSLEEESYLPTLQKSALSQRRQRLPLTSEDIEPKSTLSANNPLERKRKRRNSIHAHEIRSKRLGLRDWSEVLGAAALSSFPQSVVARATQRCATLFDEGMAILSLDDSPPFIGCRDQVMHYLPAQNRNGPAANLDISESEHSKIERASVSKRLLKKCRENSTESEVLNVPVATRIDKFYCPRQNCMRQKQAFMSKTYLTRHLQNVHKIKGSKLKEYLKRGGDQMVGGVHIDGFLEEIVRRQGWRGCDGELRQRTKIGRYAKKGKLKLKSGHSPPSLSRYDNFS